MTDGAAGADEPQPRTPRGAAFPVPDFLPAAARTVLPWTRRHVLAFASANHIPLHDAWSEALAALIRASVYFQSGAGSFTSYARTAVLRALPRYCARRPYRNVLRHAAPLDAVPGLHPSPETLALLAETARGH